VIQFAGYSPEFLNGFIKMKQNEQFGPWGIEYLAADGARISRLTYEKMDLLTTEPQNFTAPQKDYGL